MKASASVTLLFEGIAPEEAAGRAARAGFAALEFQLIDPALAARYVRPAAQAGLEVALVNMPLGDFLTGGPGLSAVPGRAADFAAALDEACAVARLLRPAFVHLGPSRIPAGAARGACLAQLADNARRAIDRLAPLGARISVEVLNAREFPGLALDSCERALELIDAVGHERLALQYDFYHAGADGRDIPGDLQAMLPKIGHVQFADHPGRAEPGTGTLALAPAFAALRDGSYAGHVGAEYRPTRPVEETLGWMTLL